MPEGSRCGSSACWPANGSHFVLRVLAKIAMIVAVLGGTLLAGESSAQSARPRKPVRRTSYSQEQEQPQPEEIAPGETSSAEGLPSEMIEEGEPFVADEESESLLGNLGWFGGRDSLLPFGFPGLDPDAEALIPDGTWFNRGPQWYVSAAVTMLQKSAPTHQGTGLPVATALEQSRQTLAFSQVNLMTTSALDTRFVPGLRLTAGRNLYEDILHRQHALEFTFLGLNTWDSHSETQGIPFTQSQPLNIVAPNLWSYFLTNPAQHFNSSGQYIGPFGFNFASEMKIKDTSSFANFEINYRISKLPRADRVAQMPDGRWMQVGTTTLVHSFLFGVRGFSFTDNFHWLSTGSRSNGTPFYGTYDVKTTNALVGAQIGGDIFLNANKWSIGIRSKAGVYGNLASQTSFVQQVDPEGASASGAGKGTVGTTAFIGDLGFLGTARLTERIYFRASYDFMWVGGLANAAEQLQYTTNIAPTVRKNGHLLFQGISLGFDVPF